MSVYEIVKLVGTCVGLILGAIVFFALFFRSMAWVDLWIKYKTGFERTGSTSPAHGNRNEERRSAVRLSSGKLKMSKAQGLQPDRKARSEQRNGVIREQLANRKIRSLASLEEVQSSDESSCENSEIDLHGQGTPAKSIENASIGELASKTPSRIANVHLMSGETIERVSFCSKEKAQKICEGLGFTGIVLENDDGQINVVRESNIKLVTWKVG